MKNSLLEISLSIVLLTVWVSDAHSSEARCPEYKEGQLNLYWGDLHVHSAFSLDAYAFGTTADPGDAFAFARGQELTLPDKSTRIKLQRPLDFAAVTDHAETFDVMYLCTDPEYRDGAYCEAIRARSGTDTKGARHVFVSYLLPLIAGNTPRSSPLCDSPGIDCGAASQSQWQRVQHYANRANSPCEFTAFIANEWSATPNDQHWHRNLIYSSDSVSRDAIDYIRFPTPEKLWQELEKQCKPEQGCDVLAIPHNTNLSEGGGFDVETSADQDLRLRAKYERLIEMFQSKGNSECLQENWDDYDSDCGFEILLPAGGADKAKLDPGYLEQLNRSYARNILSRGLVAWRKDRERRINPLQMGFIGSTDDHVATPGAVAEDNWKGDAWGAGDKFKQRRFERMHYNPGGLVAVWSPENTRESLFASMHRREVYATSGTRIKLRFMTSTAADADLCSPNFDMRQAVPMGGSFTGTEPAAPKFSVIAAQDSVPLAQIQVIKGTVKDGRIVETVYPLYEDRDGLPHACETWSDPDFEPSQPAYWYARVLEVPTPRWSKTLCESLSNCREVPGANRMIRERAWSSPIWYLP